MRDAEQKITALILAGVEGAAAERIAKRLSSSDIDAIMAAVQKAYADGQTHPQQ